jgi:hypothetical protein
MWTAVWSPDTESGTGAFVARRVLTRFSEPLISYHLRRIIVQILGDRRGLQMGTEM